MVSILYFLLQVSKRGVGFQLVSGFLLLVAGNGLQKIALPTACLWLIVKCAKHSDFSASDKRPATSDNPFADTRHLKPCPFILRVQDNVISLFRADCLSINFSGHLRQYDRIGQPGAAADLSRDSDFLGMAGTG